MAFVSRSSLITTKVNQYWFKIAKKNNQFYLPIMVNSFYITDLEVDTKIAISVLMQKKGINNRELSNLTGIKEQHISNMLSDKSLRTITDKTVLRISKALSVPFETVKDGTDIDLVTEDLDFRKLYGRVTNEELQHFSEAERADYTGRMLTNIDKLTNDEEVALFENVPLKDKNSYVPFYAAELTAGKIEVFFDESDQPAGYIYAPEFAGCIACKVWGDSMYDRILPGATVFIYPIESTKYFDYGQIYMIVYPGHRVVKYLQPFDNDETKVMLVSENKRQPPYPVNREDIQRVFLVKGYWNQTTN